MSLRSKPYIIYKNKFFDHLNSLRGAYRLLTCLRSIASKGIPKPAEETPVTEMEWNNLIILDACRHDLYEEINGPTQSRVSSASHTRGFIEKNFSGKDLKDIVYITGNPQLDDSILDEVLGESDIFFEKYNTYATDWDEEYSTVLPESVVRDAKSAEKLFPDKRKIIHFMQPHYPFIKSELVYGGQADLEQIEGQGTKSVWDAAEAGEVDKEEVWAAYRDNLELLMPYVEDLVETLDGKTIITSDHGNLAGENGLYGHPGELNLKPLRKVPVDVRD